ncbi:thioredoxin domain-containing protein [Lawsonibacter faecis]|uniref:Thioredoxin domain-containing protein n=1 Tax=Lawsonibacter faecis TaxID=2763052 RepID=A0A8J6MBJ6_9FIRM|nr:thioredoxin domain-containing protein [Lawsonibacter faecis]MBC5735665.1 thioredoxin domain-containing protein [Lawsonibacter faecis]
MPNRLSGEKSPYLLQHAENPVDWYPWGTEAFERAAALDKPVFLSVGYSTCHWCHVMAHESFEDAAVAEALNRDFISIKVDREERPDVDAVYMAACVAMNGSGGWPLTVLLTPGQRPFWAGTYLPRAQLMSLLSQAAGLWRSDRAGLLAAGDELTEHLRREEESRPGAPSRDLAARGAALFAQSFDKRWGGFGKAPKFPMPHNLVFLLRYAGLTGDSHCREMAEKTLDAMYRGGLYDHVGGGFSRYSTDDHWLAPHFEKMLYDNALLALAYTEAYQGGGREVYSKIVRRTLDYVLRELSAPDGGFCCGQDADSEGVEGRYYVFTPGELERVLGPKEGGVFCGWYGITRGGNFEGKSIPNLIGRPDVEHPPEEVLALRERVYAYRLERTALHRDDKVLTAWNGLMLAALARAGLVLDEDKYLKAAADCADFLTGRLTDGDGRLLARWREGHAAIPGKLDDYAFYAWGLLELYAATFRMEYLGEAARLAGLLLDFFFDGENGGFYPYPSDGEQLLTRKKESYDGALPSGNAVAALVLSRLARLTGELRWRTAADLQLRWLAGAAEDYPAGHSFALLTLLEELWPSAELVCAAGAVPEELRRFLREESRAGLTVLVKTPENAAALAALAPFTTDYPCPEAGARYCLCRGRSCAQPVEDIEDLKRMLEKSSV